MTEKPPLKIYRKVTFFYGEPPAEALPESQNYEVVAEIAARLERENERLRCIIAEVKGAP
jgi:hypothetical protein